MPKKPDYADLVGDPLEMEMRSRVRKILRHHRIIDGVVEADLVAALKPLAIQPDLDPMRDTLVDAAAFIRGEIVGPSQRAGILSEIASVLGDL